MGKNAAEFSYDDTRDFLLAYLDLFSLLYIKEANRLKDREKEFFIANIELNARGMSLVGKEAAKYLEGSLRFQARTYRSLLKKKGWLIQTRDGIMLPPAFDFRHKEIPRELTFRFKFKRCDDDNGQNKQGN